MRFPAFPSRQSARISRITGAALFTVLSLGTAFAQAHAPQSKPEETQNAVKQEPSSRTRITLVDATGAVVSGASVALVRVQGETLQTRATTDAAGVVQFNLPPGEYFLTVQAKWFLTEMRSITVTANQAVDLTVALKIDPKGDTVIDLCEPDIFLIQTDAQVTHVFPSRHIEANPGMGAAGLPRPLQQ